MFVWYCFPWIEHQDRLWLRIRPADPLSQRLKTALIANQSDAPLPGGGGNLPSPPQPLTSLNMWSLHPILSSSFLSSVFFTLEGVTNLHAPCLRLKTPLCATSILFLVFLKTSENVLITHVFFCQLVLDAHWPYDWSNCVLSTVINCLLNCGLSEVGADRKGKG